jgi:hypothetical protein
MSSVGLRRALLVPAVLAALAFGAAYARADMTVYDSRGFGGASRVVAGSVPDLGAIGFDNKAASVVIRSGRWTLYRGGHFSGDHLTLGPGEYADLEAVGFPRDKLSSIEAMDELSSGEESAAPSPAPPQDDLVATGEETVAPEPLTCPPGQMVVTSNGQPGCAALLRQVDPAPRHFVNAAGNRCLDAGSNAGGQAAQVRPCLDTAAQKFATTTQGAIRAFADKCLEARGAGAAGDPVQLRVCSGAAAQRWTLGQDSLLHGIGGRCADLVSAAAGATALQMMPCNAGRAAQRWRLVEGSALPAPIAAASPPAAPDVPDTAPSADEHDTRAYGGPGGGPFSLDCGRHAVLVGLNAVSGQYLDRLGVLCARFKSDGTLGETFTRGPTGGTGGTLRNSAQCPGQQAVSYFTIDYGLFVHRISIGCNSVAADGRLAGTDHNYQYGAVGAPHAWDLTAQVADETCPADKPGRGLAGRSAQYVDAVWFICSRPTPGPAQ